MQGMVHIYLDFGVRHTNMCRALETNNVLKGTRDWLLVCTSIDGRMHCTASRSAGDTAPTPRTGVVRNGGRAGGAVSSIFKGKGAYCYQASR